MNFTRTALAACSVLALTSSALAETIGKATSVVPAADYAAARSLPRFR